MKCSLDLGFSSFLLLPLFSMVRFEFVWFVAVKQNKIEWEQGNEWIRDGIYRLTNIGVSHSQREFHIIANIINT